MEGGGWRKSGADCFWNRRAAGQELDSSSGRPVCFRPKLIPHGQTDGSASAVRSSGRREAAEMRHEIMLIKFSPPRSQWPVRARQPAQTGPNPAAEEQP